MGNANASFGKPDIEEFVAVKLDDASFANFNLSVAVGDAFMRAVEAGEPLVLRHPRTRAPVTEISAARLFGRIVEAAWQTGDPGLVFIASPGGAVRVVGGRARGRGGHGRDHRPCPWRLRGAGA